MLKKLNIWFLLLALVLLAGFVPALQGTQRFTRIIADVLTVSNSASINNATLTNVTLAGTVTSSGLVSGSAGGSFSPNVIVSAPTAVGTATPVLIANSAGGVSNLVEARVNSTPQFIVGPGGAVTANQAVTENGGSTNNVWVKVAAPTAIATATPAVVVDSAGVSNILEVRDAATPVVSVANGGSVIQPLNIKNLGALPSIVTTAITYTAAAGGSGVVATIPDGEIWLVHKVFVRTTTNFDCTGDDCTLTIGDGNDADGFIAANDAALQAAFTEATGFEPGFYGIENGSGGAYTTDDGGPFVYVQSGAAETIDWALAAAGNDFSAGAATIYVIYTRIQ